MYRGIKTIKQNNILSFKFYRIRQQETKWGSTWIFLPADNLFIIYNLFSAARWSMCVLCIRSFIFYYLQHSVIRHKIIFMKNTVPGIKKGSFLNTKKWKTTKSRHEKYSSKRLHVHSRIGQFMIRYTIPLNHSRTLQCSQSLSCVASPWALCPPFASKIRKNICYRYHPLMGTIIDNLWNSSVRKTVSETLIEGKATTVSEEQDDLGLPAWSLCFVRYGCRDELL